MDGLAVILVVVAPQGFWRRPARASRPVSRALGRRSLNMDWILRHARVLAPRDLATPVPGHGGQRIGNSMGGVPIEAEGCDCDWGLSTHLIG